MDEKIQKLKRIKSTHLEDDESKQEEWAESELDKPLDIPIQTVDRYSYPKPGKIESLEKGLFQIYDNSYYYQFGNFYRYYNPYYENNPLTKNNKPPEIYSLSFARDRTIFAGAYSNGEIHIYTKNEKKIVQYSRDTILSLRYHPFNQNVLLSVSQMGDVTHTHSPSGKKLSSFRIENKIVRCMDYNPRGDKCIIGFADGDMYIYNDNTQTLENKLRSGTSFTTGHVNQIHSVVFDKQNYSQVVSGGRDKRVLLWDLRTLKCSGMIVKPYILGDTVDIKGNNLIAGSYDKKDGVLVYDIRNFKDPVQIHKTDSMIYACKFSKNEKDDIFAAGGYKRNNLKIYSLSKKEAIAGLEGNDSPIYSIDFLYNGSQLIYGCGDGGIRVLSL